MLGDLIILYQLPVASGVIAVVIKGQDRRPIFVIDCGSQSQPHFLRRDLAQGRDQRGIYIGQENLGENARRQHADDAKGVFPLFSVDKL